MAEALRAREDTTRRIDDRVIDGRYRVRERIARGGMGAVYRVLDERKGVEVALKRLLNPDPRVGPMFEREYHTLAALEHPRIIEVYDYGVDAVGPYYTMELLDGRDLKELAPLPPSRACAYLRDVASSLALLHARRLLHRDLGPRNVRVTGDDRCKLIDFGALSSFGMAKVVVGTPPCVPPEALHHAALDQRADLFSLGALAYWLLTGRHAYPARELVQLPEAWRLTPKTPSEVLLAQGGAPLPPALDELVMALLTPNPFGRPASAAEVIDRLTSIAGLPPEADDMAAESYLLGVTTVGRERERERLGKRMADAGEGRGACIVIEAPGGMGSSRLLAELSVEAQLAGAVPVVVDAAAHRGPYGVVHGLIARVLDTVGAGPAVAASDAAVLARLSPPLGAALGVKADTTDLTATPGELRTRTQGALSRWIFGLAARRPLLIAVDNVQRVDEASAALLATLAHEAPRQRLLLVVAHKPEQVDSAPAAVKALHDAGASMKLRGLSRGEVQTLVESMFGDVQHTARLSEWMHRLSAGNPRACMDLAEELVRSQAVRYLSGQWVLPQNLGDVELPASLEQALSARLSRLSPRARRLAEALSVHRGVLALSQCLAMAEGEGLAEPYAALDELARAGVLTRSDASYELAHDHVREALYEGIAEERRKALHRRMGALLGSDVDGSLHNALDAGWHLLRGGEESKGADLLASAGMSLGLDRDALPASTPALRAALDVYRREGRPDYDMLQILGVLAMAAYYSDRRLIDEVGDEAIATFRRALGLELAARLRPRLGPRLSLYVGLATGAWRFVRGGGLKALLELRPMITIYVNCVLCLAGTCSICQDGERARGLVSVLDQLTVLGADRAPAVAQRFGTVLAMIPYERIAETLAGAEKLLERFDDPRPIRDLPEERRKVIKGGVLYTLGALSAFRGTRRALEYAEQLERVGLKLYDMIADQVRTNYHACRGEMELADRYRERVGVHGVQAGTSWQAEVWAPASMIVSYTLCGDAIGLRRSAEELDALAEEIPSLKRHAILARASYLTIKEQWTEAGALGRAYTEHAEPRSFIGWTMGRAMAVRIRTHLGELGRAQELLDQVFAELTEDDLDVAVMSHVLFIEKARLLATRGDHIQAYATIDGALARYAELDNPLVQGGLHGQAAAIALDAGDVARALEHLTHMEHHFRPTRNPSLIAQCERLRRRAVRDYGPAGEEALGVDEAASVVDAEMRTVGSLLSHCRGAEERAQFALKLLVSHVRGKGGYLFACEDGELELMAPRHGEEPPTQVLSALRVVIAEYTEAEEITHVTQDTATATSVRPVERTGSEDYQHIVLSVPRNGDFKVLGVAAIRVGRRGLTPPQQRFLQVLAQNLFEAGDVGVTRME